MIYELPIPAEYSASLWVRFTLADALVPILRSSDEPEWGLLVTTLTNATISINGGPSVLTGRNLQPDISGKSSWHHIGYVVREDGSVYLALDGQEIVYPNVSVSVVSELSLGEFESIAEEPLPSEAEFFSVRIWGKAISRSALQEIYVDGRDGKFLFEPLR